MPKGRCGTRQPFIMVSPVFRALRPPDMKMRTMSIGKAEKARILADEKALLRDLCADRDVPCLPNKKH